MVRLLGRIAGALGLLSLLQDLKITNLKGLLLDWLQAYSKMLKSISGFVLTPLGLTGDISPQELNVILISLLIFGALTRAYVVQVRNENTPRSDLVGAIVSYILLLILLPIGWAIYSTTTPLTMWIYVGWIVTLLILLIFGMKGDEYDSTFPRTEFIRTETQNVVVIALAVIGANYILF